MVKDIVDMSKLNDISKTLQEQNELLEHQNRLLRELIETLKWLK